MTNTYWNDRLRRAINAYYDIYNNGGCNSVSRKVSYFFPGVMSRLKSNRYRSMNRGHDWDAVEKITEPMMDEIILKVAKKKGLV